MKNYNESLLYIYAGKFLFFSVHGKLRVDLASQLFPPECYLFLRSGKNIGHVRKKTWEGVIYEVTTSWLEKWGARETSEKLPTFAWITNKTNPSIKLWHATSWKKSLIRLVVHWNYMEHALYPVPFFFSVGFANSMTQITTFGNMVICEIFCKMARHQFVLHLP